MAVYEVDKNIHTGIFRAVRLDVEDKTLIAGSPGRLGTLVGRRVGGNDLVVNTSYVLQPDRHGLLSGEINELLNNVGS